MYCSSCGQSNPDENQFCLRCGALLRQTAPTAAASSGAPGVPQEDSASVGVSAGRPYASFWVRFLAVFIDGLIVNALTLVIVIPIAVVLGIASAAAGDVSGAATEAAGSLAGFFLGFGISWLYEALLLSSARQATLGKMALGIVVIDLEGRRLSFGRASARYFGKYLSAMTLGIGYFIQPFTEKRQALHDLLAATLVVRAR